MKSAWRRMAGLLACAIAGTMVLAGLTQAQQVHQNGFEKKIGWVRSGADAPFDEKVHALSEDVAHSGQRSEYLQIAASKTGTFIHYQYGIGRAVITDEFSARIWVKANRPGIKLYARLILPNERDPKFLESPLSTLLPGEEYQKVGRFQQLEIPRPQLLLEKAQQVMQKQLGRPANFEGAYIDALVLNVYAPGQTEVWIDDLEVGPVGGPVPVAPPAAQPTSGNPRPVREQMVRFDGNQGFFVGDRKYFMRGVRWTDTPMRKLRDAGFNTIYMDAAARPNLVREALDLGFWLVPQLHVLPNDPRFVSADNLAQSVSRFADNDGLLFWNLGDKLNRHQADDIIRTMQQIQSMDGGRYFGGAVADGMANYSSRPNFVVGAHRFPLCSSLELLAYRDWLDQRCRMPHPGLFRWTSVQTHLPDEYTQLFYERTGHDAFSEPVGPQPEQIRLLTYTALAAGYRGIVFSSDRWLADSHQGRDRLLSCALLNLELDMLEPILTHLDETPQWIDTKTAEVKAAVLRTSKGALVVPIWLGKGSQYVPGQASVGKITMVVPQIPQTMQAWHISPADVHNLQCKRVVGGTEVTLPEFSLTAAILFSADQKLVQRLQEQAQARRQLAAQWSFDLAYWEMIKMRKVHDQLVYLGHVPTQSAQLLAEADKLMVSAEEMWKNRNFTESYHESQRALRPVRILARMHWDRAVKELDTPVASPYAVSYYTLPRHWQFMEQKDRLVASTNVLPGGDFELGKERARDTWHSEETIGDDVEASANHVGDVTRTDAKGKKVADAPHGGQQCAMLQIKAPAKRIAPTVLEKTRIAIVSPTVRLQPGTLVQVTVWAWLTEGIQGSPDGAMFFDSAGGEELAVRLTETMKKWKKFTLYRRIPASGTINVTLALTGLGSVYFDDVTIEPLVPGSNPNMNVDPVRTSGTAGR